MFGIFESMIFPTSLKVGICDRFLEGICIYGLIQYIGIPLVMVEKTPQNWRVFHPPQKCPQQLGRGPCLDHWNPASCRPSLFWTLVNVTAILLHIGNASWENSHRFPVGSRCVDSTGIVEATFSRRKMTETTKKNYPKNPWDVMGRQKHLFWGPRGVTRRVWCFHRRGQDP